jgi:hypothetical protein
VGEPPPGGRLDRTRARRRPDHAAGVDPVAEQRQQRGSRVSAVATANSTTSDVARPIEASTPIR